MLLLVAVQMMMPHVWRVCDQQVEFFVWRLLRETPKTNGQRCSMPKPFGYLHEFAVDFEPRASCTRRDGNSASRAEKNAPVPILGSRNRTLDFAGTCVRAARTTSRARAVGVANWPVLFRSSKPIASSSSTCAPKRSCSVDSNANPFDRGTLLSPLRYEWIEIGDPVFPYPVELLARFVLEIRFSKIAADE